MSYNLLGFVLIGAIATVAAAFVSSRAGFPFPQRLFMGAVAMRLIGSTARYEVLQRLYDGIGDASGYYAYGLELAEAVWQLDFAVLSAEQWFEGPRLWWGTSALRNLSGIVLSVIGPTMRGEFLFFSLLSFAGLTLMALAVHRLAGARAGATFAAFVWYWPSLWFWPSSIGKESVIFLAIGLVVFGFAGNGDRIRWLPYLAGLVVAFSIRPHVAVALAATTGIGLWLGSWRRLTPARLIQTLALAVVLLVTFRGLSSEFGLADADLEGVQEFVSYRAQQTLFGGSSLGAVPTGILAVPRAFINIWLRPLPWDVHNSMALLSALETGALWFVIFRRRRDLRLGLARWRKQRLLQLAVPLLVLYTAMIGLTFGNLGIIVRQRSPLLPFVFLLLTSSLLFARARQAGAGRQARPVAVPGGARRPSEPLSHPRARSRQWARR